MRADYVFHVFNKHLDQLIAVLEQCPPDKRDVIPHGFKNHIHWHLGHVIAVTQFHVYGLSGEAPIFPEIYDTLFAYGTKPGDWEEAPPQWDVLIAQLEDLRRAIHETFENRLDEPVAENFLKAENIGELIYATSLHLFYHQGAVYGINNALK
ncbi:DinB family protein [Paenibacillus glycanilyticus]|uniref:DinB family protein n=1 Tax=Paenibacillus glycanilyticus TaxID=126569 RepID=UPI00203C707B|nr:DinB family protein [Paenibacillus glycanilyticus]MCM3629432.1 DinB family protein [Paenibacillus glycanilyticus]